MATSKSQPGHAVGQSHRAGDATNETKQEVIDAILKKAEEWGLSIQDKANLIAFAKIESGFNPNAVSPTHASGVMQITQGSAKDARDRLSGSKIIGGRELGAYQPFDMDSNIDYGIAIYLDKKRRANSNAAGDIYKKYNTRPAEYNRYLKSLGTDSEKFREEISRTGGLKLETVVPPPPQRPATHQPRRQHPPAKSAGHLSADSHQIQGIAPPAWSQPDSLGIRSPMVCYDMHILEGSF